MQIGLDRLKKIPYNASSLYHNFKEVLPVYAVIKSGGKQYRVSKGDTLRVESLPGEPGDEVAFESILIVSDGDSVRVGEPMLSDAVVKAELLHHGRAKKVEILKFKRRKHHMKRQGHRQDYTAVKITEIA
jgi:large subunit ribosomal protein L21